MSSSVQHRRLWGIGTARTFRPHWMFNELGLEYETKEIITRTNAMPVCRRSMANPRSQPEAARAYFLRGTAEIVRRLGDGRPYLLGDDFTVADLLLKTCLDWAGFVQIELPDVLASYSSMISGRPCCGHAMQKNFTPAALAALQSTPEETAAGL